MPVLAKQFMLTPIGTSIKAINSTLQGSYKHIHVSLLPVAQKAGGRLTLSEGGQQKLNIL